MRGAKPPPTQSRPPSSGATRHLLPAGERGPESACPSKRAGSLRPAQTSQKTLARCLRPATDRLPTNHCNRSTMRLPTVRRRRGTPSSPQRGEVPSECEAMRGPSARRPLASPPSSGATRHLLPDGEKRDGQRLPSKTEKGGEFPPGPDLATRKQRPGVSSRPPAPYPPGPHAVRRFSGPAYSRPRVSLPRLSPHRPRPPLHAP